MRLSSRNHRKQNLRPRRLQAESLERRQMLSGVSLQDGVLLIEGTNDADTVEVYSADEHVCVDFNHTLEFYEEELVNEITFFGNDGDDDFDNNTSVPCEAYGDIGNDTLDGGLADDTLYGGEGADSLAGSIGDDSLDGGSGNDTLCGNAGEDTLEGGGHDDDLYGGEDDDYLDGGGGSDCLVGGESGGSPDAINNSGDDTLCGGSGTDHLWGYSGDDVLYGGTGGDFLNGNDGDDTLYGESGNDRLNGGNGNDLLEGGTGDDTLSGAAGDDRLFGDDGSDVHYGGRGNDALFGGCDDLEDVDVLRGDSGNDRLLVREGDSVCYLKSSNPEEERERDAAIWFEDGGSTWTDREIQLVDEAFALLQDRVGGSTELLKDTIWDYHITFYKEPWHPDNMGWNELSPCREIHINDWNEYDPIETYYAQSAVIHEIAHNWDSLNEGYAHWDDFAALYNPNGNLDDFARPYGKTSAEEDWATCWEVHFGYLTDDFPANPSETLEAKLDLVDKFFTHLASPRDLTPFDSFPYPASRTPRTPGKTDQDRILDYVYQQHFQQRQNSQEKTDHALDWLKYDAAAQGRRACRS